MGDWGKVQIRVVNYVIVMCREWMEVHLAKEKLKGFDHYRI